MCEVSVLVPFLIPIAVALPGPPPDQAPAAPAVPAPVPSSAPAPNPLAPVSAPSNAPGTITEVECLARGGHIEDQDTHRYLRRSVPDTESVTPYRVCRIPSAANGQACTNDGDCAGGRCFCTGALSRPNPMDDAELAKLDGSSGTGVCSDAPLPDGDWFCLIRDGKIELHGIIVN